MAWADKKRMVEYNNKYNEEHYDRVRFSIRKGQRETLQAAASRAGESVNVYIKRALVRQLREDGFEVPEDF